MVILFDCLIGVLFLFGVLGSVWDGYDVSVVGIFDEGAVFLASLFWGGDKLKIEVKCVLKMLESIVYVLGDIVLKVL